MESESWVEKYRPQTLSDIVGNMLAISELRDWAKSWQDDKPVSKAIIIYGPAGIGKTSSGYALAQDMGWEVLELNASDQRTKKIIQKVIGNSTQRGTIDGSKRLIILDEADNFHKSKDKLGEKSEDKGGEKAIIDIISNTKQPIMLIANEFYKMSYALRSSCKVIKFKPVWTSSIMEILKKIALTEGITYDKGVIEKLTEKSNGDLRAAINDLQAVGEGKPHLKLEDIMTGERDNKDNVFEVLAQIFRGENAKEAHNATIDSDKDPEHLISWIDENIPIEYTRSRELNDAYYYLSKAGWFLAQVKRRQNYSMWKYASVLMTSGVFVSRNGHMASIKYKKSQIGDIIWKTKPMRATRDSLAKKIAVRCHTPIGFARTELLPFFKSMMKNEGFAAYITASLELSLEDLAFIFENNIDSKIVQEVYDKAQSILMKDDEYKMVITTEKEAEDEIKNATRWGKAQTNIEDAWGV
jgi:replication factor C large subunit